MEKRREVVNRFLVDVFNEILKIEEASIERDFRDLSVREIHVIDAVCTAKESGNSCSAAEIAEVIRVTPGTLTTAVTLLEKKGYLTRSRDDKDKRVVHINATEKGFKACLWHRIFHSEMVDGIFEAMSDEETDVLTRALENIGTFFKNKYDDNKHSILRGNKK